jgi:hypothetical protein
MEIKCKRNVNVMKNFKNLTQEGTIGRKENKTVWFQVCTVK